MDELTHDVRERLYARVGGDAPEFFQRWRVGVWVCEVFEKVVRRMVVYDLKGRLIAVIFRMALSANRGRRIEGGDGALWVFCRGFQSCDISQGFEVGEGIDGKVDGLRAPARVVGATCGLGVAWAFMAGLDFLNRPQAGAQLLGLLKAVRAGFSNELLHLDFGGLEFFVGEGQDVGNEFRGALKAHVWIRMEAAIKGGSQYEIVRFDSFQRGAEVLSNTRSGGVQGRWIEHDEHAVGQDIKIVRNMPIEAL